MCCRQTAGSPITLPNPSSLLTSFTLVETRNSKHLCPVSFTARRSYDRGIKLIFTGGHISLVVAFKEPNVVLGLYKCNYSLARDKELSTAAGSKQGARRDRTRWRAGFSPRAWCLPPVTYLIGVNIQLTQRTHISQQQKTQTIQLKRAENLNRHSPQEDAQMADRCVRRWHASPSLGKPKSEPQRAVTSPLPEGQ